MTDGVPDLDDDQRRVVEAYRGMQQGLAVLASVPGAGKSTVVSKAAAVDLLDRAAAGDRCPHERVLITSFSRADAADLVPDIVAWINALFERGDAPAALDRGDVDRLLTQVREASRIGTVDSVLRGVCADIVTEMGFDGMPTVGNEALVEQLHQDAFDAVRADEAGARRIDRVREAYEDAPAASSVSTVLREAFTIARRRALTPAAFTDQLKTAITANYRGGSVSSLEDVLEAVSAYRDESTAAAIAIVVLTVIEVVFVFLFVFALVSGWAGTEFGNMFVGAILGLILLDLAFILALYRKEFLPDVMIVKKRRRKWEDLYIDSDDVDGVELAGGEKVWDTLKRAVYPYYKR